MKHETTVRIRIAPIDVLNISTISTILFFYFQTLAKYNVSILIVPTIILSLIAFLKYYNIKNRLYYTDAFLIGYGIVCLFSFVVTYSLQYTLRYDIGIIAAILIFMTASKKTTWIKPFIICLSIFSFANLLITLISYYFPSIYNSVFFTILEPSEANFTRAYIDLYHFHAGIAGQTGINAIEISILIPMLFIPTLFERKAVKKVLLWIMIFVAILGESFTGKRGTLIWSVLAMLLIYSIFTKKEKNSLSTILKILLIIIAIIAIAYSIVQYIPSFNLLYQRFIGRDYSSGRNDLFDEAFRVFLNHPFFGVGAGAYSQASITGNEAHNDIIQAFAECGVLGGFLFTMFFVCSIINLTKNYNIAWDEQEKKYYLIGLYMYIFMLFSMLTGMEMHHLGMMLCFMTLFAIPKAILQKNQWRMNR